MVGIQGGSGGAGFDYVQDPAPQDPSEGEEWYDTGSDRAFVYDGTNWIEQTIGDHGQLSGVGASDHHSRYSDSEALNAAPPTLLSNPTLWEMPSSPSWRWDYNYSTSAGTNTYHTIAYETVNLGNAPAMKLRARVEAGGKDTFNGDNVNVRVLDGGTTIANAGASPDLSATVSDTGSLESAGQRTLEIQVKYSTTQQEPMDVPWVELYVPKTAEV